MVYAIFGIGQRHGERDRLIVRSFDLIGPGDDMMALERSAAQGAAEVTPAMQDYLKAVYRLQEAGPVTTQRIAEELGVSGPSVTNMVKRLAEVGLLRHARYHGAELTPAGERVALEVTRHHRLIERFLVERLGFGWDEVHEEADRLEHHISEQLEARIDAALGHPAVDPHGDPIPSPEGTVAEPGEARLVELAAGDRAVVRQVSDRDPARLRYLGGLGLVPGAAVELVAVLPFDGPIRLLVDGTEHVIGRSLAAAVNVDRQSERGA